MALGHTRNKLNMQGSKSNRKDFQLVYEIKSKSVLRNDNRCIMRPVGLCLEFGCSTLNHFELSFVQITENCSSLNIFTIVSLLKRLKATITFWLAPLQKYILEPVNFMLVLWSHWSSLKKVSRWNQVLSLEGWVSRRSLFILCEQLLEICIIWRLCECPVCPKASMYKPHSVGPKTPQPWGTPLD